MRNKDKSQEEDSSLHSNASRYELSTFFSFFFFFGGGKPQLTLVYFDRHGLLSVFQEFSNLGWFLKRDLEIANMPHPDFLVSIYESWVVT